MVLFHLLSHERNLSAISIGLLIWWGGIQSATGDEATLGELIAFILYIHMLFRPIRQLADRFNVLQMGMVASERVFKDRYRSNYC